jgi:hypothetical protein
MNEGTLRPNEFNILYSWITFCDPLDYFFRARGHKFSVRQRLPHDRFSAKKRVTELLALNDISQSRNAPKNDKNS